MYLSLSLSLSLYLYFSICCAGLVSSSIVSMATCLSMRYGSVYHSVTQWQCSPQICLGAAKNYMPRPNSISGEQTAPSNLKCLLHLTVWVELILCNVTVISIVIIIVIIIAIVVIVVISHHHPHHYHQYHQNVFCIKRPGRAHIVHPGSDKMKNVTFMTMRATDHTNFCGVSKSLLADEQKIKIL